jgi:outer membrane protein assembly factor BamC
MIRIITSYIFIVFFLNGCLSQETKQTIKENRVELGDIKINYYSDKSVTSLEIPPDLTSPTFENSFRISEFANDINSNTVNLTNKEIEDKTQKIMAAPADIEVKKSGNRRWLIVDKNPEIIWDLSKQF